MSYPMTSPSLNYGSDSPEPVVTNDGPRRRLNAGQVQGKIAQPPNPNQAIQPLAIIGNVNQAAQQQTGNVNEAVQPQAVNVNSNPIVSQPLSSARPLICCIFVGCVFVFACTAISVGCIVYFNGRTVDDFKQIKGEILDDVKKTVGPKHDGQTMHDGSGDVNQGVENDESMDDQSRDSFGRKLGKSVKK